MALALPAGAQTMVQPFQGGTGTDSSAWTGCPQVTAGVWTVGTCGGGGGGGNINPTPQFRLFFQPSPGTQAVAGGTSLYSDSTGNDLNVPHLTNGTANTDGYASIATLFASSVCTVNGCYAITPKTSASVEAVGAVPDKSIYINYRLNQWSQAGNFTTSYSDNSAIGQVFIGPYFQGQIRSITPQTTNSQPEADMQVLSTVDMNYRGWNLGNAGGWTVKKGTRQNHLSYVRGITQLRQTELWCLAAGDCANQYNYLHFEPGNYDASGEGVTGNTTNVDEEPGVATGVLGSGVTTGSQVLTTNLSTNAFITDGGTVVDITKGTITGFLAGNQSTLGSTAVGILPISGVALPVTGVAAGSGWAIANQDLPAPTNPAAGASDTINVSVQAGSLPAAPFNACIAGSSNWEQATVTGVSGSNLTIYHYKNHAATFVGRQTSIWWGGLCGQFYSDDITVAQFSSNHQRNSFGVVGATDATHMAYTYYSQGASPAGAPTNYALYNVTSTGAVRASNVVTFSMSGQNYTFNKQPNIVISGCSDSSFNGTFTVPTTDATGTAYTYAQTAADATTTGCVMAFPAAYQAFHLYPGAEAVKPLDHTNANITVAPNTAPWATGDTFEALHGYAARMTGTTVTALMDTAANATLSGALFLNMGGRGVNSTFRGINIRNNNQCNLYLGCGGNLTLPPAIYVEQATGGIVFNQIVPGSIGLYYGDFGDGVNHTFRMLATNHSFIDVNFATNVMNFSASTMGGKNFCLQDGTNCQTTPPTWMMKFQAAPAALTGGGTYYIGETGYIGGNANVSYRVPAACAVTTVTASEMYATGASLPSSELPQITIFKNGVSVMATNWPSGGWSSADQNTLTNTNPNFSVVAGDLLKVNINTPSWGTPPSGNANVAVTIYCK